MKRSGAVVILVACIAAGCEGGGSPRFYVDDRGEHDFNGWVEHDVEF